MSRARHDEKRPQPSRRAALPAKVGTDRAGPVLSPRYGQAKASPRYGFAPGRTGFTIGKSLRAPTPNGLPEPLKTNIEAMSGLAMDDVRVHRNSSRPDALDALAFAQGADIHLAAGEERQLPHEAWHVVQQKQGRVPATARLNGVPINDDATLEREAHAMSSRSAGAALPANAEAPATVGLLQGVAQRAIKPLTEDQMRKLAQASAQGESAGEGSAGPSLHDSMDKGGSSSIAAGSQDIADGPIDLDYFNYLQGLYVGNGGTLFVRIGKVVGPDPVGPMETLYARVDDLPVTDADGAIEQAEATGSAMPQGSSWMEPFNTGARTFYTSEEKPISLEAILARSEMSRDMVRETLGLKLLTGGESDDKGGYGAIEFRFKKDTGTLFVRDQGRAEAAKVIELAEQRGVQIKLVASNNDFRNYKLVAARFPYPRERVTDNWIYAEEDDLAMAILSLHLPGGGERQGGSQSSGSSRLSIPAGVPEVSAPTKRQEVTFTHSPVRRGREAGQAAAMGKCPAGRYAAAVGFPTGDWEWLHLRASRLGGPSRSVNLVAGTAAANTHMIPYERAIYDLARNASRARSLKVVWESDLWKANGQPTHVAQTIRLTVQWTFQSMNEENRQLKAQAEAIDGASFSGTTGASFTKLDRDLVELNVARARGT